MSEVAFYFLYKEDQKAIPFIRTLLARYGYLATLTNNLTMKSWGMNTILARQEHLLNCENQECPFRNEDTWCKYDSVYTWKISKEVPDDAIDAEVEKIQKEYDRLMRESEYPCFKLRTKPIETSIMPSCSILEKFKYKFH